MRGDGLLRLAAQFDSRRISMDHRVKPGGDDEQITEGREYCECQEAIERRFTAWASRPRRY
jgi:hypothetical protein